MSARSTSKSKTPAKRGTVTAQLLFRYRGSDTVAGVSRKTVTRLAKTLGLTETQAIHLALARLAQETLPRYEPDDAPLTQQQLAAIRRLEPQGRLVVSEDLFA
jgi:hypothetical protein